MVWTIIVLVVIMWLLGFFGRGISPRISQTGGWIHILIIFAVILIVLNVLKIV